MQQIKTGWLSLPQHTSLASSYGLSEPIRKTLPQHNESVQNFRAVICFACKYINHKKASFYGVHKDYEKNLYLLLNRYKDVNKPRNKIRISTKKLSRTKDSSLINDSVINVSLRIFKGGFSRYLGVRDLAVADVVRRLSMAQSVQVSLCDIYVYVLKQKYISSWDHKVHEIDTSYMRKSALKTKSHRNLYTYFTMFSARMRITQLGGRRPFPC